jgi:uncharacterized protein
MIEQSTLFFLLMTGLVAFMIGLAKGGLGGTLGALATPMMALVMPPAQVIGLLLPILMIADVFAVGLHWGRWDRRLVWLLIPGAIVGVTIGTFFITNAPTSMLRTALGIIVLFFTLYKLLERPILGSLKYSQHNWHGQVAGTIAGFSSALAHTGGPPISIYLLMQDVTPQVFIATSALFFMILNWIKVPYYFYAQLFDFPKLWQIAWLLPLVPLGAWTGRWAGDRIPKQTFEWIIVGLLGITGFLLVAG